MKVSDKLEVTIESLAEAHVVAQFAEDIITKGKIVWDNPIVTTFFAMFDANENNQLVFYSTVFPQRLLLGVAKYLLFKAD